VQDARHFARTPTTHLLDKSSLLSL